MPILFQGLAALFGAVVIVGLCILMYCGYQEWKPNYERMKS